MPGLAWAAVIRAMSTKSREVIWSGQVRAAKMNAESARQRAKEAAREADRAEAYAWSLRMKASAGQRRRRRRSRNVSMAVTGVRGKIGGDGIERISTQALFDLLEVPQRVRSTGACRRLAKLMRELGWTPTKARG